MKSFFDHIRSNMVSAQPALASLSEVWNEVGRSWRGSQRAQPLIRLAWIAPTWIASEVMTSWILYWGADGLPASDLDAYKSGAWILGLGTPANIGLAAFALMGTLVTWICLRFPAPVGIAFSFGISLVGAFTGFKLQLAALIQYLLPLPEREEFLSVLHTWGWLFALYAALSGSLLIVYGLFVRATIVLSHVSLSGAWKDDERLVRLRLAAEHSARRSVTVQTPQPGDTTS